MVLRRIRPRLGAPVLAVLAGAGLLAGGLGSAAPAHADFAWCWDDPVVSLGGVQLQTLIGVQGRPDAVRQGVHAATVTYTLPHGVSHKVLSVDNAYFKERVRFKESDDLRWQSGQPLPVRVHVSFDSVDDDEHGLPARLVNNLGTATLSTVTGTTDDELDTTVQLPGVDGSGAATSTAPASGGNGEQSGGRGSDDAGRSKGRNNDGGQGRDN